MHLAGTSKMNRWAPAPDPAPAPAPAPAQTAMKVLKKFFLCNLFISVSATIVTTLQKTERKKPFVNKA